MYRAGILTQCLYTAGCSLRTDKVAIGQFGIAVAQNFIDGSRNLTTFDMGAFDIVCRADQCAGQRLYTIPMHQHEIWLIFHNKVRKPEHGFREDHVLGITGPLVDKFMHCGSCKAVYFNFCEPIAFQHMHARDEEGH